MSTEAGAAVQPAPPENPAREGPPEKKRGLVVPSINGWWTLLVVTVLSVAIYGRTVLDLGLYLDDWALMSAMDDAHGHSLRALFEACRDTDPAGRPGGCVYHAAVYAVTGGRIRAYHLLSVLLLIASSMLLYAVLIRCRLPRIGALGVVALHIVYPGSDAVRLWPTAVGAQYILGIYLLGVLLGMQALRAEGWRALALHAASLVCFVGMVFTYEVVLPLIATTGGLYLLSSPRRRAALTRGGFDLVLAASFAAYRIVIAPVDPASGFVVERSAGQWVDRLLAVWRGAWHSWHSQFLPSTAGLVIAVAVGALVLVAAITSSAARRAMRPWATLALASAAFALVAVFAYVTANDLYIPQPSSLFNRLNLAAAPAYCGFTVGLLGLLWVALRTRASQTLASAAVALLVVGFGVHQVRAEAASQAAYARSWDQQIRVINVFKRISGGVPREASILSFGHPIYERGYIPVLSTGWDLRGAIDLDTSKDPRRAIPWLPSTECRADGVWFGGAIYMRYDNPASPVYAFNPGAAVVRPVRSDADCQGVLREWGVPPYLLDGSL